jgi:hypothetical protein
VTDDDKTAKFEMLSGDLVYGATYSFSYGHIVIAAEVTKVTNQVSVMYPSSVSSSGYHSCSVFSFIQG